MRLAVAVNLAIHYGRATRDREATVEWSDRVLAEAAAQHAEGSPRDLLMASITLRAASFGPFVRGDHDAVAAMLKQAEAHAVDVTGAPGVPLVLADENRYAVLETITNAAVARGDRETALAAATALTAHDPREPRAWLQLGAVHWDDGRTPDALDAYRTAAVLGAPFTGTAWYCTGRCHEALGDLDQAAQAYANSVAAEPLGITALHRLHGVADRTGQRFLMRLGARPAPRAAPPAGCAGFVVHDRPTGGPSMTTISPTVPFSPVPKESDASVARFAEFRLAGLGRFAGLLGSRLPAAEAALLERGARLAAELDRPEWTDIALHPYYSYWWSRLSQAVAAGRAAEVTSLVPELSRFLLIPLLRRGDVDLALPPPRAA